VSRSIYAVFLPYDAVCPARLSRKYFDFIGVPYRIRTGVAAVRGQPLRKVSVR
jgi:hypothetical protein